MPVVFPPCYQDQWLQQQFSYLDDKDYKCFWEHPRGLEQWWIDAFTVDPHKMLLGLTGLWEHGTPQPVTSTRLENASVGSLPIITVYIAVHPKFGTHAFFPRHGARGGGGKADSKGGMFEGFKYWFSDMDPDTLEAIARLRYCNQPQGIQKFMSKASDADKAAFESVREGAPDFDPRHFLVRFSIVSASTQHSIHKIRIHSTEWRTRD